MEVLGFRAHSASFELFIMNQPVHEVTLRLIKMKPRCFSFCRRFRKLLLLLHAHNRAPLVCAIARGELDLELLKVGELVGRLSEVVEFLFRQKLSHL